MDTCPPFKPTLFSHRVKMEEGVSQMVRSLLISQHVLSCCHLNICDHTFLLRICHITPEVINYIFVFIQI